MHTIHLCLTCVALALLVAGCQLDPEGPLTPVTSAGLLELVEGSGSRAVLVNVWATWCQPCREEFPDLLRLRQTYGDRGLELLLVSADFDTEKEAILRFLEQQQVGFPTYIKDEDDMQFIERLSPQWSGALPASFLYDAQGRLVRMWQGQVSFETLEPPILELLRDPTVRPRQGDTP